MTEISNSSLAINQLLTKPIAFNCWKHHLHFIKNSLEKNSEFNVSHLNIHDIVQHIGESNVDFYYGSLDVNDISKQVISYIETLGRIDFDDFTKWVNSNGVDFKSITLSDGSTWTIRLGSSIERFIHIHPSRHSKKTVRVKSSTLKTVLAYFYTYSLNDDKITVEKVNRIRNKIVKLPSVRPNSQLTAVSRLADYFLSD
jgi:hypothetical protein